MKNLDVFLIAVMGTGFFCLGIGLVLFIAQGAR